MRFLRFVFVVVIVLNAQSLFAQVPAFDKLEMLYDQQHYGIVYRRANRLLDNPEYDFSQIPKYYKAISTLQLAQDPFWNQRHKNAVDESFDLLNKVKSSAKGKLIFEAHYYELSSLRTDLESWVSDLKRQGEQEEANYLANKIASLFEGINVLEDVKATEIKYEATTDVKLKDRIEIIGFAKKQLGVPYVSAGDNPSGFDCSGFTTYVMNNAGVKLPRRAKDQYEASQKIKEKDAQIGDLVFFSNGTEISHVGIIISELGKPKTMIHASSSKGISIVEIDSSNYWKTRVAGYGRFVP
jgi:hypothetical protein